MQENRTKSLKKLSEIRTIGQRIAEARKAKGLTQSDLSKLVDKSRSGIAQVEKDIIKPDLQLIARIVRELNISCEYLTGETDTMEPPAKIQMYIKQNPKGGSLTEDFGGSLTGSPTPKQGTGEGAILPGGEDWKLEEDPGDYEAFKQKAIKKAHERFERLSKLKTNLFTPEEHPKDDLLGLIRQAGALQEEINLKLLARIEELEKRLKQLEREKHQ